MDYINFSLLVKRCGSTKESVGDSEACQSLVLCFHYTSVRVENKQISTSFERGICLFFIFIQYLLSIRRAHTWHEKSTCFAIPIVLLLNQLFPKPYSKELTFEKGEEQRGHRGTFVIYKSRVSQPWHC